MSITATSLRRITGLEVMPADFNGLVRELQLIFAKIDTDKPASYTTTERDSAKFDDGAVIFNTTDSKHQGFDGTSWNDFY